MPCAPPGAKRMAASKAPRSAGAPRRQRMVRTDSGGARPAPAPAAPGVGRLWAPWRMAYIEPAKANQGRRTRSTDSKPAPAAGAGARAAADECLFCRVRASGKDRADLVLARRPRALLMLNRYPYNPAHLMVAVLAHKSQFGALSAAERRDLIDLVALAEQALGVEYRPHGLNYGANVGRVAGAGFPGHLHLHLVPRWDGDTNFMPVLGETKVLPESLDQTWHRLRSAIRGLGSARRARRGSKE